MTYARLSQIVRFSRRRAPAESAYLLGRPASLRLMTFGFFAELVRVLPQLSLFRLRVDIFPLALAAGDFVLSWIHVVVLAHGTQVSFKLAATYT